MIDNKTILGYMPQGTGSDFPFDSLFDATINVAQHGLNGVDVLVLWGGEDIASSYYSEHTHPKTQNQKGPSARDKAEFEAMKLAVKLNIPIIGVCRGAQFLCAFSGGKLIQHVNNHHSMHDVTTSEGEIFTTSSCHHQMMYPYDVDHFMLAVSTENRSSIYEGGEEEIIPMIEEPEVVYFPKTRGLAIQGHPEWLGREHPFNMYCLDMVRNYLFNEEVTV